MYSFPQSFCWRWFGRFTYNILRDPYQYYYYCIVRERHTAMITIVYRGMAWHTVSKFNYSVYSIPTITCDDCQQFTLELCRWWAIRIVFQLYGYLPIVFGKHSNGASDTTMRPNSHPHTIDIHCMPERCFSRRAYERRVALFRSTVHIISNVFSSAHPNTEVGPRSHKSYTVYVPLLCIHLEGLIKIYVQVNRIATVSLSANTLVRGRPPATCVKCE